METFEERQVSGTSEDYLKGHSMMSRRKQVLQNKLCLCAVTKCSHALPSLLIARRV